MALFVLNVPTFLFAFLTVKCAAYLVPSVKQYFFVRWIVPAVAGVALMLFGVGFAFLHLDQPWPTSPALSGWGCLGILVLLDTGLLVLWSWLKYREFKRKLVDAIARAAMDVVRSYRDRR